MNKYFALIVFVILFSSCRKEIDINVPDSERKIVLNAMVHPDSVFSVNVFRSNHVQDNLRKLLYLNNATATVFENGNILEVLALDASGYYRGINAKAEVGHEYEIEVAVPNLTTVKAKIETLNKVSITSVDSIGTTIYNYDDYYGDMYSETLTIYKVFFQDNFDTQDFYRFKAVSNLGQPYDTVVYDPYSKDTITYTIFPSGPSIGSDDPALEVWPYWDGYYYFSDKLFNGTEYGFEVLIGWPYEGNKGSVNVYLEHVSSSFYNYVQSIDAQNETEGLEMFFQTVQVMNNIENGYGILGTTTVSQDSIILN